MPHSASVARANRRCLFGAALFLLSCGSSHSTLMATDASVDDSLTQEHPSDGGPPIQPGWTKPLGRSSTGTAFWGLGLDRHGGVIVLGETDTEAPFLRRYDAAGNTLWSTPTAAHATTIATDAAGNTFAVGTTDGTVAGQMVAGPGDVAVEKRDLDGNLAWARQFGSTAEDQILYEGLDESARLSIVWNMTRTDSFAPTAPFQVTRYDAIGAEVGTVPAPNGYVMTMDASGNLFFVGVGGPYTLTKQDVAGGTVWVQTIGGLPLCMSTDRDGNVLVGGWSDANVAQVQKYSPTGDLLWARTFGTALQAIPRAVVADAHGNLSVVGLTGGALFRPTSATTNDAFIAQYDPDGNPLWTSQFGSDEEDDEADQVAVDEGGALFVMGMTKPGPATASSDVFLMRIVR